MLSEGYRVYRKWAGRPWSLQAALRNLYEYPEGSDRATGWLYLQDREPVTDWPGNFAEAGPGLLAALKLETGITFTAACYQAYLDGSGCGWHSDPDWDAQAIISLGVTRKFGVRRAGSPGDVVVVTELRHGDLLVMPPGFQRDWEHRVPEENVKGERCSIVFRSPLS